MTITSLNGTSPTYLVKVLHQDKRNGEHPHEPHYSNNQFAKHLFIITCETQIHGPNLGEVDWGPSFMKTSKLIGELINMMHYMIILDAIIMFPTLSPS